MASAPIGRTHRAVLLIAKLDRSARNARSLLSVVESSDPSEKTDQVVEAHSGANRNATPQRIPPHLAWLTKRSIIHAAAGPGGLCVR
jgi:hypothetical protein